MEMNIRLRLVLSTLEGVTVSGRDNLERVLGSIQEIERIINVLENPAPEQKVDKVNGTNNVIENIDTEVDSDG